VNWLNIHTATLDSPEFLGADPLQRAAWLCLLRYCAGQENGGTIPRCAGWMDWQWQQIVRVTLDQVQQPCALYSWQGDDLTIAFYPLDKELEVKGKRETASTNGKKGGRPRKEASNPPLENPEETQKKPTLVNSGKAEGEKKKKKKENGNTPSSQQLVDQDLIPFTEMEQGALPSAPNPAKLHLPDSVVCALKKLYNLRATTRWNTTAVKASQKLNGVPEPDLLEEIDLMVRARAAGWQHYRKDAETLMNHWEMEISRAKVFLNEQQSATRRQANNGILW